MYALWLKTPSETFFLYRICHKLDNLCGVAGHCGFSVVVNDDLNSIVVNAEAQRRRKMVWKELAIGHMSVRMDPGSEVPSLSSIDLLTECFPFQCFQNK
jgi:hypothetical protein